MKRVVCYVLLLLIGLSLFILPGCSDLVPKVHTQIMKSYPVETAPGQIIKTENQWVMLQNVYGGLDHTITVGQDLDSSSNVYSAQDISIWYFEANDNGIVWCEKSKEFYTYKVYAFNTENVETIRQVSVEEGFQPQNVGIFGNIAYYCLIDYEKQEVRVIAYDILSKTTTDVNTFALEEKNQPYFINLETQYLSFACSNQVSVFDMQSNETVYQTTLPDDVKHVFSISYDSTNDYCALYYSDGDSEDIGVLKEGENDILSVFTFSPDHYAYQDKIECHDGHIYWIAQANVTGRVTDHYKLIDYNYIEHKVVEVDRTFSFCRAGNDLYILRFNKNGDYTHIDLCQY